MIYLINAAYFLMLCGFVARDILYLRTLLVFAQSGIALYAWESGVPVIAAWNVLMVTINTTMAVKIVRERRAVTLPAELRELHERHFAALSPPEFLRWWRQGQRETLHGGSLTRAGERPAWLYFLIRGTVRVSRDREPLVELGAGYFVGEMSLLTGDAANADVEPLGEIEVVRWPTPELRDLRQRNPALWTKIQSVIGHDLVEKIRRQEERMDSPLHPSVILGSQ
jgi:CRP-like cAMP-binding protein